MILLFTIFLLLLAAVYVFIKRKQRFWKSKGVPQLEPKYLTAELNFYTSDYEQYLQFYRRLKSMGVRYGGAYFLWHPVFIPIDIELVKTIMIKDFEYFVNRSNDIPTETDPMSGHLFSLADERWRTLRAKLTPTFTSAKMKMMFETILNCTISMSDVLNYHATNEVALDAKDMLARFTTDIISSCAFGIECNSLQDPDSEFRKIGRQMFEIDMRKFKLAMFMVTPTFFIKLFRIRFLSPMVEEFLFRVVKDTVEYREAHKLFRKDFMHLLLQLKNMGKITDDETFTENGNQGDMFLNMTEITAQCFIFFAAGFETSSTTMTFALFELAKNKKIQEKLRTEIKTVLTKYEGKITYDAISEMTYLENVIKETLRKYPPVSTITRQCSKTYTIPGTTIKLERNDLVQIPVIGIHMDPEFYPDPEKFDPDRFTKENEAKRPPFTWLPFGDGPRKCIGLRFGLMQTKAGITSILNQFRLTLNNRTQLPIKMDPGTFITSANGGIWLNVNKLDKVENK